MRGGGVLEARVTQVTAREIGAVPVHAGTLGDATREHRRVLRALGDELRPLLGSAAREALDVAAGALGARAMRIAVTGRAGSGFPRIANVIAGRPRLLPSVAPAKTATVSRITFRKTETPAPKGSPAQFRFFDAPAWEAIISGGGRLRRRLDDKATAALVSRLDREVEEMRTRAYMRLGDEYHKVLGTEHRIEELTSPVAARYLGAEDAPRQADGRPVRARFADITAEAEIFVPLYPFVEEASIIVTPGFDREFVLREERTAMVLEASDLCIAILDGDAPMNAETREMLGLLLDALGDRLVVLLDHDPDSDARVDRAVLREVVGDFCTELLDGRTVPVVLCSSVAAERGMLAQSGALQGDPRALLEASNVLGVVRALEEALFWGPGLTANEAAAETFLRLAEVELETLGRKIAMITDRRERIRDGSHDIALERARRDDARDRLIKGATTARKRIEDQLSTLWGRARNEGLRILRTQAEAIACGQLTGPGASTEMRNARAPLALVLKQGLGRWLGGQATELATAVEAERSGILELLARAEITEDLPIALQRPIAFRPDLEALMLPIEEASVREPKASAAGARIDEVQRRLMVPYQAVVEKVAEDATLVLGNRTREMMREIIEAALARMEQQADAANRTNELSALISRHSAIESTVGRLGAFRSATARGQEPIAP